MSHQPIYFWQLMLTLLGVGLVLHSVVSKEAFLIAGHGKIVRLSQSVLGLALTLLALARFL
jgi:hypothetical protein